MGLSKHNPHVMTTFRFFDLIKDIKDGKITPGDFPRQEQNYPDGQLAKGTLQEFYDRFTKLWGRWHSAHFALRACNFGGDTKLLTSFGEIMQTRAVTAPDRPMVYCKLQPISWKGPYSLPKFASESGEFASTLRIFTNPRDATNMLGLAILEHDPVNFAVQFAGVTSRDFFWWLEHFVNRHPHYPRMPQRGAAQEFPVAVIAPEQGGSDTFSFWLPLEDGYLDHLARVDLPVEMRKTAQGWVVEP
jgi:hypothetical protein